MTDRDDRGTHDGSPRNAHPSEELQAADEALSALLDEALSALLDGELDASEAAALRARARRDPVLAARIDALAAVDDALRALPARAVPSDLRARLQERIEASESRAPAQVVSLGSRRRRVLLPAALAALAAGLALYLAIAGPRPPDSSAPRLAERGAQPGTSGLAEAPDAAPEPDRSSPAGAPALAIARGDENDRSGAGGTGAVPGPAAVERMAGVEPRSPSGARGDLPAERVARADAALDEQAIGDEELAIALDYEALRDFPVIEQLELLELLAGLDSGGAPPDSQSMQRDSQGGLPHVSAAAAERRG